MDGDEPDAVARRRRHLAYLGGHIKHNPLLIVSRRLGHSSPATTYAYLEYTDDPMNAVDAAFADVDRAGRRHLRRHRQPHARRGWRALMPRREITSASSRPSPSSRLGRPDRHSSGAGAGPDRHDAGYRARSQRVSGARGWPVSWPTSGSTTPRSAGISRKSVGDLGRRAIRDFCTKVDLLLGKHAHRASLARQHPDIAAVLAEWERTLPAGFRAGSTTPPHTRAHVRALIGRRAQHDQRPVTASLRRLVDGASRRALGQQPGTRRVLPHGQTRPGPRGMGMGHISWTPALPTDGHPPSRGRHPAEHGWTDSHQPAVGSGPRAGQPTRYLRPTFPSFITGRPSCGPASSTPIGRSIRGAGKDILVRWLVQPALPQLTSICTPTESCWSRPPGTHPKKSPR